MTSNQDRTLEQLLADTADVRARLRSEGTADQPPARLDEAILAASRRAVSAPPVVVRRSTLQRWQVPLAAAAVVVIATSVALLTLEERGHERILDAGPPHAAVPSAVPEAKRERLPRAEETFAMRRDRSYPSDTSADASSALEERRGKLRSPPPLAEQRDTSPRSREVERDEAAVGAPASPASPAAGGAIATERQIAPMPSRTSDADEAEAERGPAAAAPTPGPDSTPKDAAPDTARKAKSEALLERGRSLAQPGASNAATDLRPAQLERIRKRWEAGDHSGARDALAAFLHLNPGYRLPEGYPVPPPEGEAAQESPRGDR